MYPPNRHKSEILTQADPRRQNRPIVTVITPDLTDIESNTTYTHALPPEFLKHMTENRNINLFIGDTDTNNYANYTPLDAIKSTYINENQLNINENQ